MESKVVSLGNSLLVPCVQELAKEPLITVPPRYLRPHQDQVIISDAALLPELPVVDFQRLLSEEYMDSELTKLHFACKDWGFFQLINHGVSSSLLEKVKMGFWDLFNLPMEEKKKFWQIPGDVEGFGQLFVVSEEQKLDWSDIFFMNTSPIHIRNPHLFPKLPLPIRDTIEAYSLELKNLALAMFENIAKALKMEVEEMRDLFENGLQSIRMNYYPPCPQPEQVIGLTPHSDGSGLTILLQVNDVEGLQIRKDGMWVPVKPLSNAFTVNIGNVLEIITNGEYRSIEHCATVNSAKERLSIATFYGPNFDGIIGPASSLITQKKPPLFRTLGVQEYYKGLFSRQLHGKSYLATLRI